MKLSSAAVVLCATMPLALADPVDEGLVPTRCRFGSMLFNIKTRVQPGQASNLDKFNHLWLSPNDISGGVLEATFTDQRERSIVFGDNAYGRLLFQESGAFKNEPLNLQTSPEKNSAIFGPNGIPAQFCYKGKEDRITVYNSHANAVWGHWFVCPVANSKPQLFWKGSNSGTAGAFDGCARVDLLPVVPGP